MSSSSYIAGIELGGTSCVAAIAKESCPTTIIDRVEVRTTTKEETFTALANFLKEQLKQLNLDAFSAVGIASFGPVDLDKESKTFGCITSTPKERWGYVDVVGFFKKELKEGTPIVFETDVNAPATAEVAYEMAKTDSHGEFPTVVYITIGTGVGVGININGQPVHGLLHPEGGHMVVPKKPGDEYPGCCTYKHYCCVEGMIDSQAIAERTNTHQLQLDKIEDSDSVWDTVGYYLGSLCLNITYLVSPHVVVLGGGIMKRAILYDKTRYWFKELMKGYLDVEKFKTPHGLENYIRKPVYGDDAGIVGALELCKN